MSSNVVGHAATFQLSSVSDDDDDGDADAVPLSDSCSATSAMAPMDRATHAHLLRQIEKTPTFVKDSESEAATHGNRARAAGGKVSARTGGDGGSGAGADK